MAKSTVLAGFEPQGERAPDPDALAYLSAMVDASDDALVGSSLDGTILAWNRCAESLFGYSAAEATGRSLSLLLPPERETELASVLALVATGEHIDRLETVRMRKDGSRLDVSLSVFPVRGAGGEVIGACAIARDITERKRMASELQRWREQLRAIAQGVDDAVVVRAPGGEVVYANDNAAHLLGYASVADLLASPIAETNRRYRFYTESGELIPPDRLPGILALRGIETPPTVMRYRFLQTGEERWAVIKAVPIRDETGQVQFAASIFSDLTERKRTEDALRVSEARFQAFMDNSPILAFIKDEEARFVYVNPQFEQVFATHTGPLIGVSDTQIVSSEVARRIHEDDFQVLSTGKLKQIMETIPAPDSTPHHWLTFKFPMSLPGGQRFIAGASVEITDRVRAEEELQRYVERLHVLSRQLIDAQEAERRRISRDLHDQVGQSLTAIKIDLQLAQHQARAGGEGRAEGSLAERLDSSIDLVERTIQQVREFSLDLRPSILDDLGLPSALLWYTEEQARRAGFTTELAVEQLPTRLSPELEIACFRLAQEAITNVVRHARAARVAVQLRCTGDELVLVVSDDGEGFDAQALGADEGHEKKELGLDRIRTLGLAGMYERALLVGGTLSIQSAPGEGTTVRATFPTR